MRKVQCPRTKETDPTLTSETSCCRYEMYFSARVWPCIVKKSRRQLRSATATFQQGLPLTAITRITALTVDGRSPFLSGSIFSKNRRTDGDPTSAWAALAMKQVLPKFWSPPLVLPTPGFLLESAGATRGASILTSTLEFDGNCLRGPRGNSPLVRAGVSAKRG